MKRVGFKRTTVKRKKAPLLATPSKVWNRERPEMKAQPKKKPARSRGYLAFVREHPCTVCQARPVHAHHDGPHGIATKASDLRTIPLCALHHGFAHHEPLSEWLVLGAMVDLLCEWIELENAL